MKATYYLLALALGLSGAASAESTLNEGQTSELYPPLFFAEYTPQTALDMVRRLPGFILIEADNDIRGFAAGAGNVLIDGARPTTKSGGIAEALSRIPSAQVAVVEILRGAGGNGDTAGQSVVANVKRIVQSGRQQVSNQHWQLTLQSDENGKLSPSTEFTSSGQVGLWRTALNINAKRTRTPRQARSLSYSADQQLLNTQLETRPSTLNETFVSGDAKRDFNKQSLSVNGRLGWSQFIPQTQRQNYVGRLADDNPDSHFNNDRDSQYYTGELGFDWLNPLDNGWSWRVRNLNNNKNWFVSAESRLYAPAQNLDQTSSLRFDEHKSENIVRSTLSHHHSLNTESWGLMHQEYGAEVAYSNMQSWQKLNPNIQVSEGNESNSYAKVVEKRSELFSNITWQVYSVVLETGLAAEHSQLKVTGDNDDSQSLFFIKPSLALIFDHSDTSQYRFTLRRSVGQLDFSDFAASSDLVNDRAFSGNPQLRPDTQVQAAFAFDHRFGEKGAIAIELYHQWRSDVLEQIQLPSGAQGLGNAGDAKVKGLKLSANLPLEQWIKQALLEIKVDYLRSTFNDPVTAQTRPLTELSSPDITLDFRQDLIEYQLSWGVGYQTYARRKEYFVNEYNAFRGQGRWNAFIESYAFDKFKWRLEASNITDERQRWLRRVYQDDRSGPLQLSHDTQRTNGPSLSLTLNRSF